MHNEFATALQRVRDEARREAAVALREHGFSEGADGIWVGQMDLTPAEAPPLTLAVQVVLPSRFPDVLPEVLVDPAHLPRALPHVEANGKICVVPSNGVLFDATRPRQLVADALERAEATLVDGIAGRNLTDFQTEFLAYWEYEARGRAWSISDTRGGAGTVFGCTISGPGLPPDGRILYADSADQARGWAEHQGREIRRASDAFLLPLHTTLPPPAFDTRPHIGELLKALKERSAPADWERFQHWLGRVRLPVSVLFAQPVPGSTVPALGAFTARATRGEARKRAMSGFRPDAVRAVREIRFARADEVAKIPVDRFDAPFLRARGGASDALATKTVAILGCGAVGSHATLHVASLGVRGLRLVDPDDLQSGNIYRHALGVSDVGRNKAAAVAAALGHHYPHLELVHRGARAEDVLTADPDFLLNSDALLIAVGDATVELRLNALLGARVPRVHVWVEPLGLGGHAVAVGLGTARGCFACLIDEDDDGRLRNAAALAAPGQDFQRSLAGCAGSFSPFSSIDADRAGLEAATLLGRVLTGAVTAPTLLTWRGDGDDFERAGFALSRRAARVEPGGRVFDAAFQRVDCSHCGGYTA